jgi:hypothetical protein
MLKVQTWPGSSCANTPAEFVDFAYSLPWIEKPGALVHGRRDCVKYVGFTWSREAVIADVKDNIPISRNSDPHGVPNLRPLLFAHPGCRDRDV